MDHILTAAATTSILVAAGIIATARTALRPTTLLVASRWAMGAVLVWLITVGRSVVFPGVEGLDELMWYSVALLGLCPAVAVLGARRPGESAWTYFVLLPMLAVLGWPMLTVWGSEMRPGSLQLEVPQLAGFVLVLLMGAGNYVGTRFWLSACLYAVALCLLVAPLSVVAPVTATADTLRRLAGVALGVAAVVAYVQCRRRPPATKALDVVWNDYRNLFGIVWSRRLQDRLNGVAIQQNWPVRVTPVGFFWSEPLTDQQRLATEEKVEQSLRWMLRRFVDPEWIDARLTSVTRELPRERTGRSA